MVRYEVPLVGVGEREGLTRTVVPRLVHIPNALGESHPGQTNSVSLILCDLLNKLLGHPSLLVPSHEEPQDKVDGSLSVLWALSPHQVRRRADEKAGKQGSYETGSEVVLKGVLE